MTHGMKNRGRFSTPPTPAPGWWAVNRRRAIAVGGTGLLVATLAVLIAPAWSNNGAPETPATRTAFDPATARPAAAAGGVTLGMSTAIAPATRADQADSLYEDASLAALCQDRQIPPEDKPECAGVAAKSDRELESMLRAAGKGGNVAAKTYLLRRSADEATARLGATDPLDENQRAESLAQLKASMTELRDIALASKDPRQLMQLSSLYLRNAEVLPGANLEAAALTIAVGLGKGRDPAEFGRIYEMYSPEEAAGIKQKAEELSTRLKGAAASGAAGTQQTEAKFTADCQVDKNNVNPCLAHPY